MARARPIPQEELPSGLITDRTRDLKGYEPEHMTALREFTLEGKRRYAQRMATYDRLRAALSIDKMHLDNELMMLPANTQEAGELCSNAIHRRETCALIVKVVVAKTAEALRNVPTEGNKQKSEAQVNSETPHHPHVAEANREFERFREEAALWQVLASSWDVKRSALRATCELIASGYISSASITETRREDINAERRRLAGG